MSNTEKNKLVQECVAKALAEVYPDVESVDRATVNQVLRTTVDGMGLTGLFDVILKVFNDTLKTSGLVGEDYWL